MIDVNSIKFQNESNKLELNGPHRSCTTCDDKSLPFFLLFFFFLRKKLLVMVKKELGDSWAHQNSIFLYSQLLRKFDFQEVGNLFGRGIHLLFTYSRIHWLLDLLHLFYMCTSAFYFFILCNLMIYSFDSCFLIMVSKISLTCEQRY